LKKPFVMATCAGQYGIHLPFSREHASEADHIGQILMAKAGYEPSEAIEFWKRMEERGGLQPWEFLSSHPNHVTRQAQLREWLPEAMAYYADTGRALPSDLIIAHARPAMDPQTQVLPIALRPSLAPDYWWRFQKSNDSS
jgi:predicted Zn-dependent protease